MRRVVKAWVYRCSDGKTLPEHFPHDNERGRLSVYLIQPERPEGYVRAEVTYNDGTRKPRTRARGKR